MDGFSKAGFVRAYVVPALLMFALPAVGLVFSAYALSDWDAEFVEAATNAIQVDPEIPAAERGSVVAFYEANPPSVLCASPEGREALSPGFVDGACGDFAQLGWIGQASLGSIALGLLSLIVVIACVALSFVSRNAQFASFVAGWNFLRVASTLQVLAQGFIAVMLSFWVTAFFFERYFVKLVLIAGVLALGAAGMVILAIFRKPADELAVEGEALSRESSPALWARIEALCERIGTAPPDHIVGGIDDNFFVTEHPVTVGDRVLEGRTLFVSLSLLKRLSKSEADAILAHEMGHFSGGDTAYSKRLSPLLSRYGAYMGALGSGGLTVPIAYFMLFYRSMFELSLGRSSRERELRADRIACESTSPLDFARSILKVSAYSAYRARVEGGLFERDKAHSELNIAQSVAVGFTEYARGPRLGVDLEKQNFPHPFDSHPPLSARLAAADVQLQPEEVPELVVDASVETWFGEIGDAQRIEDALWDAYQRRFRAAHEEVLAYRYLPSTPEEQAHVERFFPPLSFVDKDGAEGALTIDCQRVAHAGWEQPLDWSSVTNIAAEDEAFRGKVVTFHYTKDDGRSTKAKLSLKKIGEEADALVAHIGRYYGRYQAARAYQDDPGKPEE